MGVPTLEVSYTSATTGRGDHEVHKGHVMALEKKYSDNGNAYGYWETAQRLICHYDLYTWTVRLNMVMLKRIVYCSNAASGILR
jgi:hypothetical protein